jgi:hypothetical protein
VTFSQGVLSSFSGVNIIRLSSDETKVYVGFESGDVGLYDAADFTVPRKEINVLVWKSCSKEKDGFWNDH